MFSVIAQKKRSSKQAKPLTINNSSPNSSNESITVDELETRLYHSTYNLLILSELFVCLPFGAHRRLSTTTCSWIDKILILLHIVWSIGIYASLVVTIYGEYTQSNKELPTVQKPLFFCEYIVYLVHLFQILLSNYWARHKCRCFLRTIAEFDCKLISFGLQPEYQQLNRFISAHLYLIMLYVVATVIVDYFYTAGIMEHFIRSLAVYLLPNLVLCFSLVQYYTLLYAVAQRMIRLNEALHTELSRKTSTEILREKVQGIRLSYSTLQIFTKEINNSFSRSLVLVYIGSFTNLSVNIFLLYKYLDDTSNSSLSWIMYSVVWASMHIGKMFCILYFNNGVQSQKKSTALIMNELEGQNPEMEETITHFILQLIINTRTNVVCGVAELNMNFITSLLVGMSTIFIFLLQYDITYEALTQSRKSGSHNQMD